MNDLIFKFIGNASPLEIAIIVLLALWIRFDLAKQINGVGKRLNQFQEESGKHSEKIESKIDSVNARIDKLNDLIIDLYKTFFKRAA